MACKTTIVGIGPGDPAFLIPAAKEAIDRAEVLIGGKRNLEDCGVGERECIIIDKNLTKVVEFIAANDGKKDITVLASGDTGLFSIGSYLRKVLPDVDFTVLPGISSLQYLMAKMDLKWNELKIVTLHGHDDLNIANIVARNKTTAFFTGGKNTPNTVAEALRSPLFDHVVLTVGENLSYENDRIVSGAAAEIAAESFMDLTIVIVENDRIGANPWIYETPGLPDSAFLRDEVPMTKSEIRALIMSKLRLKRDSAILEIGAGSGSCTVEMALIAYEGKVTTIEKNPAAVDLCRRNIDRFGLDNIELISGSAPEDLPDDLEINRLFIGGSGGSMAELIAKYAKKPLRVVVSAITLETVGETLKALDDHGFEDIEIIQASLARSKKAGSKHLMMALNPITIISGELK